MNQELKVQHDTRTYEVVINGITCTYCGEKEHADMIHRIGDTDMCDACYEGNVA